MIKFSTTAKQFTVIILLLVTLFACSDDTTTNTTTADTDTTNLVSDTTSPIDTTATKDSVTTDKKENNEWDDKEWDEKDWDKDSYGCTNEKTLGYKSLEFDGVKREYIVYTPTSYNSEKALPVVFNFHGFGGCATDHMKWADMRAVADRDTFLVVYPQGAGLDGEAHWNPALLGGDNKSSVDDLGFTEAMIEKISAEYSVDSSRIYAVGYSNGGMMAYGLAEQKSELFAAVASVSGAMLDCPDSTTHPMPILHIHGTNDYVIPYDGGSYYNSVQQTLDCWISLNNTVTTPTITADSSSGMKIEHFVYDNGDNMVSVEHYKYSGGEHVWFEKKFNGQTTTELVWKFFERFDVGGLRE